MRRKTPYAATSIGTLIVILGLTPLAAPGEEVTADAKLEEVVVSARKRVENAVDVPISIDTVSASQIEDLDLESLNDIAKFTPGMFYTDYGANRADRLYRAYVVRGLSLNNSNNLSDAALLFVDGAPVASGNLPGVIDIERVEVLKGPQAAYFGRNTFAGAISVTTREPSNTWQARAVGEASSYGSSDLALALEGPLVPDVLMMRVSAESLTKGGEYTNYLNTSDRLGGQKTNSVGVTVKFIPTDKLTVRANFNYFVFDDEAGAQARLINNSLNCDPGHTGHNTWYCGTAPQVQPDQIMYDFDLSPTWRANTLPTSIYGGDGIDDHPGVQSYNYHGNLKIDYELPYGMTLESITASDVTNSATISDEWYDPNKVNPYYGIIPGVTQSWNWLYLIEDKKEDFSQELRLTSGHDQPLRWTVGGSYLGLQVHFGHVAGDVPLGEPLNIIAEPDGAHTYAGFGGIYYDVLPPLELGAEGRYQSDQIYSYLNNTTRANGTFTSFSPRFTVKYKLDPTTALYALWSRGVLPGAFNTQLLPGAAAVTPAQQLAAEQVTGASPYVKQETLETEELGIKSQFLDGRGFLTFDVYAGKVTNEQVSDSFTVLVPGNPVPYVGSALVNQGAVDINGVETEIAFQVTPEFRVSANYALNNTKITAGPDTTVAPLRGCSASVPSCIDVDGNRLPNAPKNQGDITAQYTRPLNASIRWYAGADYIYVGSKFAETANLLSTGAQQLVNARLGLTTDSWKIEAWGKNINNNKTPELVSVAFNYNTFVGNAVEIALPQKPTYGVRVTYKFQ